MILSSMLLALCWIQPFVSGVGFRGFTYEGLEEPEPIGRYTEDVTEGWIVQSLDHFNHRDNRTWSMVISVTLPLLFIKVYRFIAQ